MDIEKIREYCLSLPMVTEDMAFGEDHLLFRICNKIFVCLTINGEDIMALKCNPEYSQELRDRYSEISPAYHWNKKYWIQIPVGTGLKTDFLKSLILHSYSEIIRKLPKKILTLYPELIKFTLNEKGF